MLYGSLELQNRLPQTLLTDMPSLFTLIAREAWRHGPAATSVLVSIQVANKSIVPFTHIHPNASALGSLLPAPPMIRWGQWFFLSLFAALALLLAGFSLWDKLPARNYIDAMARGQYAKAGTFLAEEVSMGNPQAQNALANLYYLGLGHPTEYRRAAQLYHAAAKQGFAAAQLNLGHLYKQGLGVSKNAERAFGWYTHANISGSPWAEFYQSQISVELTLTPLQMATAKERWYKLDALANEPL